MEAPPCDVGHVSVSYGMNTTWLQSSRVVTLFFLVRAHGPPVVVPGMLASGSHRSSHGTPANLKAPTLLSRTGWLPHRRM